MKDKLRLALERFNLTSREIDVLACILNNRGNKKISSILEISPRTTETHIRHNMLKLECHSRDAIIDLIERSGVIHELRNHYYDLLRKHYFHEILQKVNPTLSKLSHNYKMYYSADDKFVRHHAKKLKSDLIRAGINSITLISTKNLMHTLQQIQDKEDFILLPQDFSYEANPLLDLCNTFKKIRFIQMGKCTATKHNFPSKIYDFSCKEEYFKTFLLLIGDALPSRHAAQLNQEFETYCQNLRTIPPDIPSQRSLKNLSFVRYALDKSAVLFLLVFLFLAAPMFWVVKFSDTFLSKSGTSDVFARSEFGLPHSSVLLERSDILKTIESKFKDNTGIQIVALYGIGGAGKTTLARCFAQKQNASIIWEINAETSESIRNGFEELSYAVAKTSDDKNELEQIQKIENRINHQRRILDFLKTRFQHHPGWYLIFDNVTDISDVFPFFPQEARSWGIGHILLTTRDANIKKNSYIGPKNTIQVTPLTLKERQELFANIMDYSSEYQESNASSLRTFLHDIPPFPLDISTAAYYMKDTKVSYNEYLQRIKSANEGFHSTQENLLKDVSKYTSSRYKLISLSLDHILEQNSEFEDILWFVTFLDSQDIPHDLLRRYKDENLVNQFIHALKKNSLISIPSSAHTSSYVAFSMHRTLQAMAFAYLQSHTSAKRSPLFKEMTLALKGYMHDSLDKIDVVRMNLAVRHGEAFLKHSNLLDVVSQGDITGQLGLLYFYLGNTEKALEFLEKSLELHKQGYGLNALETAYISTHLGNAYITMGRHEEAKHQLEVSSEIYTQNYGFTSVETTEMLTSLSKIYKYTGNYPKAESLLKQALENYTNQQNADPTGIARVHMHLGTLYRTLGDYKKAMNSFEQSLIIYRDHDGPEHINTAWALVHLGEALAHQGLNEKAKPLIEQGIAIYHQHYEKNHINTVWALNVLGRLHMHTGNYEQARELFNRSLRTYKEHYGATHVRVSQSLHNLGCLALLENKTALAEEYIKQAISSTQKDNYAELYALMESLADIHIHISQKALVEKNKETFKQQKDIAHSFLQKALELALLHFPKSSPHVQRIQVKLEELENQPKTIGSH